MPPAVPSRPPCAIEALDADHLELHGLFEAYAALARQRAPALQRRALAEEICLALTIHARLEEELLYPVLREALEDDALIDGALDEHGSHRDLVALVLASSPQDPLYDASVAALAGQVAQHVEAEREQVFNRALAAGIDLQSLARSIARRRSELRELAEALREEALAAG